jgi:hypothetical protein
MSELKAPTYEESYLIAKRHGLQVFSSPGRMPLSQYTHDKITATAV